MWFIYPAVCYFLVWGASLTKCLPKFIINPNLLVHAGLLGIPEPIPGIGGGNNIDSRQGLRFRGLGRGRRWATEIRLQLGNPQILLSKLLCCCPQRREAVTWLAWSQEAGMGAENHSIFSLPKGHNLLIQFLAKAGISSTSSRPAGRKDGGR